MGQVRHEFEGNGKDQARLNERIERTEEVGERQPGGGIRKWSHRGLHSVARKINPFQKMSDLVSPDPQSDLEHFRAGHFLTHGCIKARAALLNLSEVKGGYVRDRLNMIVAFKVLVQLSFEIGIGSGNGGTSIESERLRKSGAQVGIGSAAVANVPTGVHVEFHEVGKTQRTG